MGSLLILLLAATSVGPVAAQEGLEEALALVPDIENGEQVYAVCAACHQAQAWGTTDGTFPQLAGQSTEAAIKQLMDIRAMNRDNPTMYPFTLPETLGGMQNLVDVSAYIESQPMAPDHGVGDWGPGTPECVHGKSLYEGNCAGCHGADASGDPAKNVPLIQGQHYLYMLRQFVWIRTGKRRNGNEEMARIIQSFSNEDVEHVIGYTSLIPVAEKRLASAGGMPGAAIQ